jgi:hypothetical protein
MQRAGAGVTRAKWTNVRSNLPATPRDVSAYLGVKLLGTRWSHHVELG